MATPEPTRELGIAPVHSRLRHWHLARVSSSLACAGARGSIAPLAGTRGLGAALDTSTVVAGLQLMPKESWRCLHVSSVHPSWCLA
jgi:hypothetical protein